MTMYDGSAQSFCGVIERRIPPHPDSTIAAYDRFGNPYLASEMLLIEAGDCSGAEDFILNYQNINDFSSSEQATICEVFTYLSELIDNPTSTPAQIRIRKAALSTNVLAAGTPMFRPGCGIRYPKALEIFNGITGVSNDAGVLEISDDENVLFHTIDNDPLLPDTINQIYDLYSAVLHEALHILGFASRIGAGGGPLFGSHYTNWDLFLHTAAPESLPLIVPADENIECCDQHMFNPEVASSQIASFLNSLVNNCGGTDPPKIVFGENVTSPTVNGTPTYSEALSHLDMVCDSLSGGQFYVMHYELSDEELRRELHEVELDILRSLGYIIDEENNTGEDCIIVTERDFFDNISISPGQTIIIPFSFLLANDIHPGLNDVTVVYDEELTLNSEYIEVESIDTDNDMIDDAFEITGLPFPGGASAIGITIRYRIEGCNNHCDDAEFIVRLVNLETVSPCQNPEYCDNLVCHGDFEAYEPTFSYYFLQAGLPPSFPIGSYSNSPDIAFEGPDQHTNQNQFLRLIVNEYAYFPLTRSIPAGCTLSLSFRACGNIIPAISVSENIPCFLSEPINSCQADYGNICLVNEGPSPEYHPYCILEEAIDLGDTLDNGANIDQGPGSLTYVYYDSEDISWENYTVEWTNQTGQAINYLIFQTSGVVLIDDIVVTQSCPATAEIEADPAQGCNLGMSEICFDVCADDLVAGGSVQLTAQVEIPEGFILVSGSATTLLDFFEESCQTVCLMLLNTEEQTNPEIEIPITVSQCSDVLDESEITLTLDDCFACEDCTFSSIGADEQTKLLSDVLDEEDLPLDGNNINVCIKGTLVIDQDYNMVNSIILMQPGSRILVEEGYVLSIVKTQLSGCDQIWRGIELEKGGDLKMVESMVSDAQYAIYTHPAENGSQPLSELSIFDNAFLNNFVGFFVPETPYAKINAAISGNRFVQTQNLLSPYSGQTTAPEGLPEQNDQSLAGMVINNLGAFSSMDNRFEGLTSGIVSNYTNLIATDNTFENILSNDSYYPAFTPRGTALGSYGGGDNNAAISENTFTNCPNGIIASYTQLKATYNTMDDVGRGIWASLSNAGGIAIETNTISNATGVGILTAHADPAGQVTIVNNTVSTDANTDGAGIGLVLNQAPALLTGNDVTVKGTGVGIGLYAVTHAQLEDINVVTLDNTDEVQSGFLLQYARECLLRANKVNGTGLTGKNNIAIEVVASPGNIYCCNAIGNTRVGVSVTGGSSAENNFRGTIFGNFATSLYLPNGAALIGSQTHTENRWQGSGGAVYDNVSSLFVGDYPFIVDASGPDGDPEFLPPSYSPSEWFTNQENPNQQPVCAPEICMIDGFVADSPDSKRIASGDIDAGDFTATIVWELQRYLYRKLQGWSGPDSLIQAFMTASAGNTIGDFQELDEDIEAFFSADATEINALKSNLVILAEKLDSLLILDQILRKADAPEVPALMAVRQALVDTLFSLATLNLDLTETIGENRADAADAAGTVNAGLSTTPDFEKNEQTVNSVYLSWVEKGLRNLSGAEKAELEAVALQCPFTGGNAVFRARAMLSAVTGTIVSYDDSTACAGNEAFLAPPASGLVPYHEQELQAFPNPTKNTVTITWATPITQAGNIRLFDLYGRQIEVVALATGDLSHTMNMRNLPTGIYALHAALDGRNYAKKIVVKH